MMNNELMEKFLHISKIEKNLSKRTLKAYKCDLRAFLGFFKSKPITTIGIEDLRGYLTQLGKENLKDSTIRRKLATIKVFFTFLEDEELIQTSPTNKLKKKFKVSKRLPRVLSVKDVKNLLKATHILAKKASNGSILSMKRLKRLRDRAMLEILFATGIRIDELIRLSIHDVDLNRKTLIIFGKGRKERLLYVSCDEVLFSIAEYLNYRAKLNLRTNAFFVNKFGTRLSVHSLRNIFNEYCQIANISCKFTPHCLRHTMATMLIENGADVRSVQEILGHSRISTTEIYLTISKRRKQEVLSRFNQRNYFHFVS